MNGDTFRFFRITGDMVPYDFFDSLPRFLMNLLSPPPHEHSVPFQARTNIIAGISCFKQLNNAVRLSNITCVDIPISESIKIHKCQK